MKETPSQLPIQSFLLNFPFTISSDNPNNAWMKEKSKDDLIFNKPRAYKQFMDLYNYMAGQSLVYLLPSEGNFQDLTYVANLGIYLPHIKDENIILLSNFTSEPRRGEELVGETFFKQMGYKTYIMPHHKWEGEADLKYLRDNIFIGGYGIRSEYEAYEYMEENFNMNIIKIEMNEEYLYHLDCSLFPLNPDTIMMCTELYDSSEIADIERYSNIIDVDIDDAYSEITNCVRLGNSILAPSSISEMTKSDKYYYEEKHKIATLEKICSDEGYEPVFFNLEEFHKSGAALSCLIMNLNRVSHLKSYV